MDNERTTMFSAQQPPQRMNSYPQLDTLLLLAIAAAVALAHVLTNNRYGFHRDELQFLSDALHMDWGFVAYPPLTPLVERIGLAVFGVSLVGLRIFSVLAQATAIFVSGMMARELGGRSLAQITTALAVALSPLPLFQATEFQYSSFDYLWWVLIAYFVIRLLESEEPRWLLVIGALIGVGLMTKYSIVFFVAGIVGGMVFTSARRYLRGWWFWSGVALALLIFLPNLVWQVRHGLVSLHFLEHIHARDVGEGRTNGFVRDQFLICANLFAAPLWLFGLVSYLRDRRYRMMAWMYLIPLVLFMAARGRGYYLAAAYPMLMAMGAVAGERWLSLLPRLRRRTIAATFYAGLAGCGLWVAAVILPLASSGPLRNFALNNNGDLREEIGWTELVQEVSAIRDSLPPEQRRSLGVLVGNYGEQGAIELLGRPYHLPVPISMTNSAWLRGYPDPPPSTLIVVGFSREEAERAFTSCRLAGHNGNAEGIKNEESQAHPDIFVCGGPRKGWPTFWRDNQAFG